MHSAASDLIDDAYIGGLVTAASRLARGVQLLLQHDILSYRRGRVELDDLRGLLHRVVGAVQDAHAFRAASFA